MKAEKVLERYQAGEKNFQRVNLRGQSFKGKDLSGADFSEADIRGANFTNAYLKGANFSCVRAGLQRRWAIGLLIISCLFSGASGHYSAIAGFLAAIVSNEYNLSSYIAGAALGTVFSALYFGLFRQGLAANLTAVAAGTVAVAVAGVVASTSTVAGTVFGASTVAGSTVVAVSVAGVVAGNVAIAIAVVMAVAGAGATDTNTVAVVVAVAFTLLSAYTGWRALAGDEKYASIKNIAIAFAATGGTSFRGANLTDANFTQATLKNTNFSKATLTRTRFYEAQKLNLARVDNTILATQAVLRLLVSGNGRGKSYADANLRGANLVGADLKEANLKNADISEATFEGACLEGANLTLTQAVGTNFTNAQMTDACVEAWNIEHTTILDNVDCRSIYLLEEPQPGTDKRERRPSSGEFKSGEFTKLFQEVFNTVDLIFRKGIDWKAFVTAFQKLQVENEGIELVI